jgi:Mn2+/Fe2+ NRAMP family transporter
MNWLKKLGPGLLFAGAAIGVSHLVQSTRAGAGFGFGLLWALVVIHIVKYPFFQIGARYAAATGESLLDGYRRMGKGVLIAYFFVNLVSMFAIQAAVTIVTAGLASSLFGITTNPVLWSMIVTAICFTLLLFGRYKLLDNLMKLIMGALVLSTLTAVFVAVFNIQTSVDFAQILPRETMDVAFLIAFLGWMPAPLDVSIWQSLWTLEKKKQMGKSFDTNQSILDFNIGFIGALVMGACFVALGALVMHDSGEHFSSGAGAFAQQLIQLYTANLGNEMYIFIAAAAFTTMFSTTITTLDASPRAMAKTFDLLTTKSYKNAYWFWILVLSIGTVAMLYFFMSEMGTLVQIATILAFLTAPFFAILNLKLICSKYTPEQYRPNRLFVWNGLIGIVFLIAFSIWYLFSL